MGPTGSNAQIIQLARSLEDDGCTVHTFESMPVEVTMTKFDMAVLVVTDSDPLSLESTDHRIQRILHAAGFLEARLAPDRVCLLVEESVNELQAPPVTQIRYPTGEPMSGKGELVKFIQAQYPRVQRDLHRQIPLREQAQSDELRVPWAMLIAVVLAALIPILLVVRSLGGDDDTTQMVGLVQILNVGQVAGPTIDDGSALGSSTASSGESGATADDLATGAAGDQPGSAAGGVGDPGSAPATAPGGQQAGGADQQAAQEGSITLTPRNDGPANDQSTESTTASSIAGSVSLPSTCVFDMRKNLTLPSSAVCADGGRVVIQGWDGPWHNEIGSVAVSTGATGTLYYESRPELPLSAGNIELDEAAARYGVNTVSITFSADGQHVHLYQSQARGGAAVTLTFTLDQP